LEIPGVSIANMPDLSTKYAGTWGVTKPLGFHPGRAKAAEKLKPKSRPQLPPQFRMHPK